MECCWGTKYHIADDIDMWIQQTFDVENIFNKKEHNISLFFFWFYQINFYVCPPWEKYCFYLYSFIIE